MSALAAERRCLTLTATAITAVLGLAALAAAASTAAARGLWAGPPHPVLEGTAAELVDVLATNLPALGVPLLLAATLAGQGRAWRALGDLITAAVMVTSPLLVGAALGAWGTRLVPYLPHLPLELAALSCSCAAWWSRRNHPRPVGRLALCVLCLAVPAAAVEVYATPRSGR